MEEKVVEGVRRNVDKKGSSCPTSFAAKSSLTPTDRVKSLLTWTAASKQADKLGQHR